ncbi:cytochrome c [Jannaschia sp. S6380]|uniref:cytochrome c4 n=1 Tax=Jannaschia sp. S6380 TaxID=2926408 RepID=UPI001FF6A269|nr:cytochrome c [Jannaschia sp. S6380]MCK0166200.1 cytochrome c [Jannaschia sp. S6380]
MRRLFWGVAAAGTLAGGAILAVIAWPVGVVPRPIELAGDPDRGAYLARAGGCIACHTDFERGGAPLAGGVALTTDFGTIRSPNVTPGPAGIGGWSVEDFARAVRQGVSPEGEPYYPAFPYPFYAGLSDQDIADLWAAFQTVPPSDAASVPPAMRFPFDQRWGLKLWRALYQHPPFVEPIEGRDAAWNRGRELVEGPAHCAACHTPRNALGGRNLSARYAGNDDLPGGADAPAIDAASLAANGWDADALAYALRSGITPEGDVFGGGMGEVVMHGTSWLSDADLQAMAAYLTDP